MHGKHVYGLDVDGETRCAHWHGPTDVIALRMHCCNEWFPCYDCHQAVADHQASVWPRELREVEAVPCGVCGRVLRIDEYLTCESRCPGCDAWHLYDLIEPGSVAELLAEIERDPTAIFWG